MAGAVQSQHPRTAIINASSSGDNTVVAAVTGYKIRVLGYTFITADAVNVRFESGAGGTALTGVMAFTAGGQGISSNATTEKGFFETASGALLNMELSSAVSVTGHLVYQLVPSA